MDARQRVGGIAALIEAATFIVGIAMFVTLLADYATGDPTPSESVAFLVDNQAALRVWNIVIFIVFGIFLVPVVLALHERLRAGAPALAQAATAFGLVWVAATRSPVACGFCSSAWPHSEPQHCPKC